MNIVRSSFRRAASLEHHLLFTSDPFLQSVESPVWGKENYNFSFDADLWRVLPACVISQSQCFSEKRFSRLPVCSSTHAVSYYPPTRAKETKRPFPEVQTYWVEFVCDIGVSTAQATHYLLYGRSVTVGYIAAEDVQQLHRRPSRFECQHTKWCVLNWQPVKNQFSACFIKESCDVQGSVVSKAGAVFVICKSFSSKNRKTTKCILSGAAKCRVNLA